MAEMESRKKLASEETPVGLPFSEDVLGVRWPESRDPQASWASAIQLKKPMPMSKRVLALVSVLLGLALVGGLLQARMASTGVHAASSFSFTTASDYNQTEATTANLKLIASSGVNFHLGLGDYSYAMPSTQQSVHSWISYAKSYLNTLPFVVVAGNHDHRIDQYTQELPDPVGAVGSYGREFYFDYPADAPLARIIALSPTQTPGDLFGWTYTAGDAHYTWVSQMIDAARAAQIPWVIVALHEPCLSVDDSDCADSSSTDLLNLLIDKRVDLVLQGHKHHYAISKQLAFNEQTCPNLPLLTYNTSCVVNDTSTMIKGAGTVFATVSTGGTSPLSPVTTVTPTRDYYRTWNADTFGVAKLTLTATSLTEQFLPVTGVRDSGSYSDTFTIASDPAATASVTPT